MQPLKSGAGIFESLDGACAVFRCDTGLEGNGNGTSGGEVVTVRDELGNHCRVPESTMEKYHGWAWCGESFRWCEYVCEKITSITGGIEVGGSGFQQLLVPGFADGCDFLQNVTHNLKSRLSRGDRNSLRFVCCEMGTLVQSFRR